ncbi:uncharacterized protein [Watersipora subatra]|uniref:uncharacterized protein isoform X2 n=1 Tax=Watersipora subatra TaxID=2589382 RepID=UPI00355C06AD
MEPNKDEETSVETRIDQPPAYESLKPLPSDTATRYVTVYSYVAPVQSRADGHQVEAAYDDQELKPEPAYIGPDYLEPDRNAASVHQPISRENRYESMRSPHENAYESYECHSYDYPENPNNVDAIIPPTLPSSENRRQLPTRVAANAEATPQSTQPKTWLAWSIVTLVVLCIPLGIPATILSILSARDYKQGKYSSAKKKATAAFVLNIIGTVIGGVAIIAVIGVAVLVAGLVACCSAASSS